METENKKQKRDWFDIGLKALTPAIAGILIAWVGFVSNLTLTSITNKQETARLITELQIQREQAESDLRKDVFDQTLQAFLLKNQKQDYSLSGMSKQLLRLELLALNFGDSLSLSPLFNEFREDLQKRLKPTNSLEKQIYDTERSELRARLYSLARRVASAQVSSLEPRGVSKKFRIPLEDYKHSLHMDCNTYLYNEGYTWPDRQIQYGFGIYSSKNELLKQDDEIQKEFESREVRLAYRDAIYKTSMLDLQGVKRYLQITVSNVDHCAENAKISIFIYKDENNVLQKPVKLPLIKSVGDLPKLANIHATLTEEVKRNFTLDYFNFPKVNNTRLGDTHRFAIVLEEFDLDSDKPYMEVVALIFPSEYASLRDRPGMKEAKKLLESALKNESYD